MEVNGGGALERLPAPQQLVASAIERFRSRREQSIQAFVAANDARGRAVEAKALAAAAQRELEDEERATSRLPAQAGARVPPHPDVIAYRDHRQSEAERLEREAVKANDRAQALGRLVESCRQELSARGIDPDRTKPRRSNAQGDYQEPRWSLDERRAAR